MAQHQNPGNALVPRNPQNTAAQQAQQANMMQLPQNIQQMFDSVVRERDFAFESFHRTKRELEAIKSDPALYANTRYGELKTSWQAYKEANEAYRQEHDRSQAEIREQKAEVERQKGFLRESVKNMEMWRDAYEGVDKKHTAVKEELEKTSQELRKALHEGQSWKNCTMAWQDPNGQFVTNAKRQIEQQVMTHYSNLWAQREKCTSSLIHRARERIANQTLST